MAYRDDLEAAQQRVTELERDLEASDAEVGRLRERVKRADVELNALRRKFDGAPSSSDLRLMRLYLGAAIAAAIVAGAVAVMLLSSGTEGPAYENRQAAKELEEAKREVAELREELDAKQKQTLADPVDPAGDDRAGVAPGDDTTPTGSSKPRFDETQQKALLLRKADSGKATEEDLRMLRAICMSDGDRACRERATKLLRNSKTRQ